MSGYKLFALIARKPGMTPEQFHDYYRHPHGTMGQTVTTMRAYVQSHQTHTDKLKADQNRFEAVAEMWIDNLEDIRNFRAEPTIRDYIVDDEPKFMDVDQLQFLVTQEETILSGPPQDAGLERGDALWNLRNRPNSVKLLHFAKAGSASGAAPADHEGIGTALGAFRHVRCRPCPIFHADGSDYLSVDELWWPTRTAFHEAVEKQSALFDAFVNGGGQSVTLLANAERWF